MLYLRLADRLEPAAAYEIISIRSDVNMLPGEHRHDYGELFWITSGRCRHRLLGQIEELETGALYLLRPADVHSLSPLPFGAFSFTNLAFCSNRLSGPAARHPDAFVRLRERDPDDRPRRIQLDSRRLAEINRLAERLWEGPPTSFLFEWFLFSLAEMILPRTALPGPNGAPDWLMEACARIRQPEWLAMGVEGFIRAAGRGHEHVCRATRRYFDKRPVDLVTEARLAQARRLLLHTSQPVTEISLDCGYGHPAQFYASFRRATGLSPLQYRKKGQPIV